MGFKRKSSRVEVGRPGRLHRGSFSAPCQVMNVSETGVRIHTRLFVKNGDVLHLSIELNGDPTGDKCEARQSQGQRNTGDAKRD